MSIKETRHPSGYINLSIVPFSRVATDSEKRRFKIKETHHVLIVDMGESE
jgi:hypothetical protein